MDLVNIYYDLEGFHFWFPCKNLVPTQLPIYHYSSPIYENIQATR